MLVLSRKMGEKILMPAQGIVVTVLEVRGDKVRVGITAPPDVIVYRDEVWSRMHPDSQVIREGALASNPQDTPRD